MLSTKRYQLENYKKYLLNRVSANGAFLEYLENCLARDDETAKHSFHKIMVHHWQGPAIDLFETLSEYLNTVIIPVMYVSQGDITTFYTSSLSVIQKMIKCDFMFPYQRNMFNIDILFNDKNSADCFDNTISIEDIVCGVVSNRLNEKLELDLSDFCNDAEFIEKKIHFYKLSLLSHFKILMLRMGRDTRSLKLCNNNLSHVPLDILNFFIKGDLIAVNLSNNNIPSISEVLRVSSKIEKLWIEGNPLCDDLEPIDYVKHVTMKFPRLTELDGIRLNQYGLMVPFFKNYLVTPDRKTKMVVEKFLTLYFSLYDSNRKKISQFYHKQVTGAVVSDFTNIEGQYYHTRNILDPAKINKKIFYCQAAFVTVLLRMPPSVHDFTTFTVDVVVNNKKAMMITVDGIFREKTPDEHSNRTIQFRRTFVFEIINKQRQSAYRITNEIFSFTFATKEQIENSFKYPIRNMNELTLIQPEPEEIEAISKAFIHLTQLKRDEAEARLKIQDWDIKKALKAFMSDVESDKITQDMVIEEDDFSDSSSLVDELD